MSGMTGRSKLATVLEHLGAKDPDFYNPNSKKLCIECLQEQTAMIFKSHKPIFYSQKSKENI